MIMLFPAPGTKAKCAQVFPAALLFILMSGTANAQTLSKVHGSVVDANGQGMGGANVLLLKKSDSSLVKGTLSTAKGTYTFENIPQGSYLLEGSATGYQKTHSGPVEVTAASPEVKVPALTLQPQAKELAKVTVTAQKPLFEQKMDRLIINVASGVTSVGSTALDVLERSPGIIVDRQNNALSMAGKEGIVVMINSKISRMPVSAIVQMLSGMNSSNIERIELITTPPANYDAEGNAGYINIIMKQSADLGTNGSYSFTAGYGNGLVGSTSLNFNHRKGKVNVYGDYSFNRNAAGQNFSFYRKVNNGGTDIESFINSERDPLVLFHNGRLGLDYQLDKKTVIGALVSGYNRRWTMDALNISEIYLNQRLDTLVRITNDELNHLYNISTNLNVEHRLRENEKLSLNLDYVYYNNNNPTDYLNAYYDGFGVSLFDQQTRSGKKTPIKFWVGNTDYSRKLGKKVDLESGVKGSLSRFINDVSVQNVVQGSWVPDPAFTARYNLEESILAAYTSLGFTINERTSAKAGLRYEYTNSNLGSVQQKDIVDRQYGNFFPTAYFSYKINDNNSLSLSYNRRITRPTFNDMAPFVIFVDPNTFFSGNPALQPAISDGVKADYLYKKFIVSLAYTFEKDPITNFSPQVDPVTNKQTLAAENQKHRKVGTITLSLPFTITKWWRMQNNAIGVWQSMDAFYKGDPIVMEQATFVARSTQSFTLPKDFSVEVSGFYRSAGLFGIYKADALGVLDLGVQKKFARINSSLRLAYDNVLNSLKFKPSVNLPEQNLVVSGRLHFSYPTIRLTYSHNFGNQKLAGKRERSTGSEEERQRVQTN